MKKYKRHYDKNSEPGNGAEEKFAQKISDMIKSGATELEVKLQKEIDTLKEQMKLSASQTEVKAFEKTLEEKFDQLSAAMTARFETPVKAGTTKSVATQIYESLNLQKEALESMKKNRSASVEISTKAATTMTTGNVTPVGTGGLSMLLNDYEPGVTPIPRAQPFFADLMSWAPTTGNTVSYAEMKNPDGGAGMTTEGAAKTQADFDLVEAKAEVEKITSYIKVSKEALSDIPQLNAEINGELNTLIKLKLDDQLMNGDGSTPDLNGIISQYAVAYDAGSFAGTIEFANYFDVLTTACTQVKTAEVVSGTPAGFMPTHIVIHSNDFIKMKLTKDSHGQYLFPINFPGVSQVINIPIIENPWMTEGEFLVGDFTKANARLREGITYSIGYENDDFTKNLVTILAEMRATVYVKSNHVKAFVTGNFDAAVADLLET